jgi:geranylgeranyl diphosphate synthase type II
MLESQMSLSSAVTFPNELARFRPRVDELLDRYTQFDPGCPNKLLSAIRYCLLAPGKRIRPLLVLAAAEMCGGDMDNALPAACAVEMIHNYSLIHDDLPAMDDDDLRRGRPACHIEFDEATAILAGDALIPLAFEIIARDVHPASVAAECVAVLGRAAGATGLVGGQSDDLDWQSGQASLAYLERIHERKTGALLTVSLELGAITAQSSPLLRQSLRNYGKHVGLAFQIADDLLDFRGSQDKMGKRAQKDADRGKLTFPSLLGEAASESRAREMIDEAISALAPFGKSAQPLEQLARFVINRTH